MVDFTSAGVDLVNSERQTDDKYEDEPKTRRTTAGSVSEFILLLLYKNRYLLYAQESEDGVIVVMPQHMKSW